ncbi:hypothetical protein DL96DRAFT_1692171 [Flagelloscypha sp. PMI_526]|nr:hypothetical protein DL96DRAFT_1692171 [Flagelloscypha sp. PMI_526]
MSDFGDEASMIIIEAHLRTFSVVMLIYGFHNELGTDDEIHYIWTPRWNKSTFFFSLNRYVGLFTNVIILFFTYWNTKNFESSRCSNLITLSDLMWSMTGQSVVEAGAIHEATDACHVSMDGPSAALSVKSVSLLKIFFRDGAIYFLFMALANLANILMFYFALLWKSFLHGRLSTFTSCLSVTLVSRMMFNLYHSPIEGMVEPTLTAMSFKNREDEEDTDQFWSKVGYDFKAPSEIIVRLIAYPYPIAISVDTVNQQVFRVEYELQICTEAYKEPEFESIGENWGQQK